MDATSPLRTLLAHFWAEHDRATDLWQVGIIVASLLIAWLLSRIARRRLGERAPHSGSRVEFGVQGAHRLLFPIVAMLSVIAGRFGLALADLPVALLNLAVPLLSSLAIIRAIVYLLRTAFDESPWLVMSERAIAWIVWIGVALHISGVLPRVTAALEAISFEVSGKRLTLLAILQAPVVVAAASSGAALESAGVCSATVVVLSLERSAQAATGSSSAVIAAEANRFLMG